MRLECLERSFHVQMSSFPGSPFAIHVSHPPNPGKVRVYGPGIENGILARFKSNFVVETRGAGGGHLTVRVRGPKSTRKQQDKVLTITIPGAFHVDMQRDARHDRTIHCKYEPREPGDYQLEVKWAGMHVPGSPFLVMIFDTEQVRCQSINECLTNNFPLKELERFMRGQMPSPNPPPPPFVPLGWQGPLPPGPPPPPMMLRGPAPMPAYGLPYGPRSPPPGGVPPPRMAIGPPPSHAQYGTLSGRSSRQGSMMISQNGY